MHCEVARLVLESTKFINLAETYQFEPVYCETVALCHELLGAKSVAALLLPQTEVLFHFASSGLTQAQCGNPYRIIGDPILTAEYPSAKLCSYSKGVYAGKYVVDAVNMMLDELDASGFTQSVKDVLLAELESGDSADACSPPSQYDPVIIICCFVTLSLFYTTNSYVSQRKTKQTSLKLQYLLTGMHGNTALAASASRVRIRKAAARQVSHTRSRTCSPTPVLCLLPTTRTYS